MLKMVTNVSNTSSLHFEVFYTILFEIEAVEVYLNFRRITSLSSDLNALTSAHFLVGGHFNQFPEPSQLS